jgi:hypothetical protein
MKRMIPVVDLTSGAISLRPSHTLTLDLPQDFDRSAAIAEFDVQSRVRYLSLEGKRVVVTVQTRPLSWRVHGEECLVADHSSGATSARPGSYTLSTVE